MENLQLPNLKSLREKMVSDDPNLTKVRMRGYNEYAGTLLQEKR